MKKLQALEIIHGIRALLSQGAGIHDNFGRDKHGSSVNFNPLPAATVHTYNFMGAYIVTTGKKPEYDPKTKLEKVFQAHPKIWWGDKRPHSVEELFEIVRSIERAVEAWNE